MTIQPYTVERRVNSVNGEETTDRQGFDDLEDALTYWAVHVNTEHALARWDIYHWQLSPRQITPRNEHNDGMNLPELAPRSVSI